MRQLTSLDAQFLNVESPTTVGHVGSLIVLYSIGYMHGDPKERRFFIYLNIGYHMGRKFYDRYALSKKQSAL